MEVKAAVALAKQHVADLFAEENVRDVGLEEIEFDDQQKLWKVTVGFSRPWDARNSLASLAGEPPRRSFKVVHLRNESGEIVSVKSHRVEH